MLAASPGGWRRRPSGEPPPLPRPIGRGIGWYLLLGALTAALWAGLAIPAVLGVITRADLAVLDAIATVRTPWLTHLMLGANALTSPWVVRLVAWATIAVLAGFRRFRHLAVYLIVFLAAGLLVSTMMLELGRMRPAGIEILGPWQGYSQPSRPLAMLALALVGALYTLVPAGRWRNRGKWALAVILGMACVARLYLAVDHPTDVATALILGWPLPVVVFLLAVPNEAFPVSYSGRRKAHLDIGGQRGAGDRQRAGPPARSRRDPGGAVRPGGVGRLDAAAAVRPRRRRRRGHAVRQALRRQPPQVRSLVQAGKDGHLTGAWRTRSRSPRCGGWWSTKTTCSA